MTRESKPHPRAGLTRIEVAFVGAVLVLAAGVVLPRVQAARADADRAQCTNNLRTLGRGSLEYEKTHGGFPPRRSGFNNGEPYSGWGARLLGPIGEEAVARRYSFQLDCFDPGNQSAVETQVKAFLCPAAPDKRIVTIQAQASSKSANPDKDKLWKVDGGPSDYITSNGVLFTRGGYGLNANVTDAMIGNQRQAMGDNENVALDKITDGLSCTLLLIEQAGRPDTWRNGKKTDGKGQFGESANARGMWAGWGSIAFGPADATTGENPGRGDATDCTVNCNNWFGIYGFHPEGANVLMCDGSVRFVTRKLDPLTLLFLTLRDDGHILASTDF